MNAQVKPNEQAALEAKLKNRRSDVFDIERAKAREGLKDELAEAADFLLDDILKNYKEGDDCAIGQIFGNVIANYALRIFSARLSQEMRNDFMPSWRSKVEP